jgi:hypothetical protein
MRQRLDSNKGGTWKGRADEVAGEKARLKDHWRDPAVINTAALGAGGAAIGGKLAYDAYKKRKGR